MPGGCWYTPSFQAPRLALSRGRGPFQSDQSDQSDQGPSTWARDLGCKLK